jgi:hypothetical protein
MLQYSIERICADIGDMSTSQWALYCKHYAKCGAHPPVYAMWTVIPVTYNAFTAPHILASIFNCAYLRWYWRCVNNSVSLILLTWCQIQRITSSLRNVYCGPGHTHCNYRCTYSGYNIQQNVAPLLLEIWRQFCERYTAYLVSIQRISTSLRYLNCVPGHIQCKYSSAYWGVNIQQKVSALILEISRQFNARYIAN